MSQIWTPDSCDKRPAGEPCPPREANGSLPRKRSCLQSIPTIGLGRVNRPPPGQRFETAKATFDTQYIRAARFFLHFIQYQTKIFGTRISAHLRKQGACEFDATSLAHDSSLAPAAVHPRPPGMTMCISLFLVHLRVSPLFIKQPIVEGHL